MVWTYVYMWEGGGGASGVCVPEGSNAEVSSPLKCMEYGMVSVTLCMQDALPVIARRHVSQPLEVNAQWPDHLECKA